MKGKNKRKARDSATTDSTVTDSRFMNSTPFIPINSIPMKIGSNESNEKLQPMSELSPVKITNSKWKSTTILFIAFPFIITLFAIATYYFSESDLFDSEEENAGKGIVMFEINLIWMIDNDYDYYRNATFKEWCKLRWRDERF